VEQDTKTAEEIARRDKEQARFDRERVELWEEMVRTQAWKLYSDTLGRMIEEKASGLLSPLGEAGNAAAVQEYEKGTVRGMLLARNLPELTIANKPQTSSQDEDE
jgi:hypothetical protein